jgi:antitoxin component YwqK of YwqJK toxin-antitoxin module
MYYENKEKRIDGEYKNNLRNGIWKAWYKDGTIWSSGEYKDGKRNGEAISYHPNGIKYIEGKYLDDIRVGPWRFYDTTGVLTKEVDFDQVQKDVGEDSLK